MSFDPSQFDWQIVRGERFNCKRPERLKAAILKAEENVTEAEMFLKNTIRGSDLKNSQRYLEQCVERLNELKAKQTPKTPTT